jgi:hypothetical protein
VNLLRIPKYWSVWLGEWEGIQAFRVWQWLGAWGRRLGLEEEEEGAFIPPPPNLPVGLWGPRAPGVKTPGTRARPGTRGSKTPGTRGGQRRSPRRPGTRGSRTPGTRSGQRPSPWSPGTRGGQRPPTRDRAPGGPDPGHPGWSGRIETSP